MINENKSPAYLSLHKNGELKNRADQLRQMTKFCCLCPRECNVNRLVGEKGFCGSTSELVIYSCHPHFGEERPLVGSGGSGTIFFSNCSLRCVFCINWEISHRGDGHLQSIDALAEMMLKLQKIGCHNINVVTPTHYSPHILKALDVAADRGLRLPLVYNSCGWERLEILKILDGIVDIYLTDFKYGDGEMAAMYSAGASSYPELTQQALMEMHRQVGVAKPESNGLMNKGLMIRHLVMPDRVGDTQKVIQWIIQNLPKDTYLNLMSQYRPVYQTEKYSQINHPLTKSEYKEAVDRAKKAGLTNLDIQGHLF